MDEKQQDVDINGAWSSWQEGSVITQLGASRMQQQWGTTSITDDILTCRTMTVIVLEMHITELFLFFFCTESESRFVINYRSCYFPVDLLSWSFGVRSVIN